MEDHNGVKAFMANGSFLSATVNRDRSRINFNHFEKLINNFHRSKTPVFARFYLWSQAKE